MIYSHEVEHMCVVKKGPDHGPAPIPEEGKWVKAKEIKAFDFKFDEKALVVPSFRWKTTESKEKLQAYADSLKKLVESIEEHLTRP
jgi:hypothetical protein